MEAEKWLRAAMSVWGLMAISGAGTRHPPCGEATPSPLWGQAMQCGAWPWDTLPLRLVPPGPSGTGSSCSVPRARPTLDVSPACPCPHSLPANTNKLSWELRLKAPPFCLCGQPLGRSTKGGPAWVPSPKS